MRERDEPYILAQKFCLKYRLSTTALEAITYMIDKNLDILIDEELSSKSTKISNNDMYSKGMSQMQKVQNKIEMMRHQLNKQSAKELTFKPAICPFSNNIWKKNNNRIKKSETATCLKFKQNVTKNLEISRYESSQLLVEEEENNEAEVKEIEGIEAKENVCSELAFEFQPRQLSLFQTFSDYSCKMLKQFSNQDVGKQMS